MKEFLNEETTLIFPPNSISEQIYKVLKERILLDRIAPSERIIESTVAVEARETSLSLMIEDSREYYVPAAGADQNTSLSSWKGKISCLNRRPEGEGGDTSRVYANEK